MVSQAPSVVPTPQSSSICSVEDVQGGTYYFAFFNACWKLQLFENGTLEGDFSDSTCTNHINNGTFQSSGIFSRFGSIDSANDVVNFIKGGQGYSGTFQFVRKPSSTTTSIDVKKINQEAKEFVIEVHVPTCIQPTMVPSSAPSTTICPIENFVGSSYYFTVKGFNGCWKARIAEDGKLKGDFSKPISCSKATFNSSGTFSIYQSIDTSTDKAIFRDGPLGWSGSLQFVRSPSSLGKELEGTIKSFDAQKKEYEVQIAVPSCV